MSAITFEKMPEAIENLTFKIDAILKAMANDSKPETDKLFTLDELIDYLPEHPARQTIYCWVNYRRIPYEKHGKRLYFRKSSISKWLDNGRRIK